MLKVVKLRLQELLNSAKEAVEYIISNKNSEIAVNLKEDCVYLLNYFCDIFSEKKYTEHLTQSKRILTYVLADNYESAANELATLKKYIDEIKPLKEILFLPYKAALWDTFDSIWEQAITDTECNVTVMPIAYNSLNQDGSVEKIVYEKDNFPKNITVTDYKEYDITLNKPDVIFIHNPYDDLNYVTRIDEKYFSSELIKNTQRLVYIPYYITNGIVDSSFCRQKGVINSWRTFVQTERMAKNYYDSFDFRENQIVPIGTPKTDYVLKFDNDNSDISELWSSKLENKRTFFVNIHLSSVLKNPEKTMENISYFLDVLSKNQDIAFIWRPHPLIEETIKSMRPYALIEYLKLKIKMLELENSIFDSNPMPYAAIACSHGYIGDIAGSMSIIYELTGKPIWLCEFSNNIQVEGFNIKTDESYLYNGKLYSAPVNCNAVVAVDISKEKTEFICSSDANENYKNIGYRGIYVSGDNILLIPNYNDNIKVINIADGSETILEFPKKFESANFGKFSKIVEDENYLWCIPSRANMILQIEKISFNIKGFLIPDKYAKSFKTDSVFDDMAIVNKKGWICPFNLPFGLILDFETGEFTEFPFDFSNKKYIGITYANNHLWLSPFMGESVIKLDLNGKMVRTLSRWPKGFKHGKLKFYFPLFDGENIWLTPHDANMIVKINTKKDELVGVKNLPKEFNCSDQKNESYLTFERPILYNDEILFPSFNQKKILAIDIKNDRYRTIPFQIKSEDIINKGLKEYLIFKSSISLEMYNENKYLCRDVSLENFINNISKGTDKASEKWNNYLKDISLNMDGTVGEKIWKYIKKHI